jgi:hypothetical protein
MGHIGEKAVEVGARRDMGGRRNTFDIFEQVKYDLDDI